MKFIELPIETQNRLHKDVAKSYRNTAYEVYLFNKQHTRFFQARRIQSAWSDDRGNYMPFGGGSEWVVKYGEIGFVRRKRVIGYDYEICQGKLFGKSKNGTVIPKSVKTKKEVINIAKARGIFEV